MSQIAVRSHVPSGRAIALTAILTLAGGVNATAQQLPAPPPAERPPDRAVGAPQRVVRGLSTLIEASGPAAWSTQGDRIAYSRPDPEGYHQLYTARPDGGDERCITCRPLEFRRRHAGAPAWHPSGDYLVFQVEKPFHEGGRPLPFEAAPGRNLEGELWYAAADGGSFGPLVARGAQGGRARAARFSHEGDRLAWCERVASGAGTWGEWVLRVAAIEISRGRPRMGKVKTFEPLDRPGFYESYGFAPDDLGVLLAAPPAPGGAVAGLDLYLLHLEGGELERLSDSPEEMDRWAAVGPDGRALVFASNRGLTAERPTVERTDRLPVVALDLWLLALGSGAAPVRLTSFNDPFAPEYAGRFMLGAPVWSPQGDRLLVLATPLAAPETAALWVLEIPPPSGG